MPERSYNHNLLLQNGDQNPHQAAEIDPILVYALLFNFYHTLREVLTVEPGESPNEVGSPFRKKNRGSLPLRPTGFNIS